MSANNQILIVGAGIGGLALGQILKANNIPFEIFERDEALQSRSQGWAIALNDCLTRLLKLLPSHLGDIYTNSVNAAIGIHDKAVILDGTNGSQIAQVGGVARGQPGHILRCRREVLRQWLETDMTISTGKHFTHYTSDVDGVTAYFRDGTSARGCILVGADGASSKIRTQLLNTTATQADYIPIQGSCTLPREKFEHLHNLASAGIIAGGEDLRYLVATLSVEPDRSSAEYYYAVCYRSSNPEEESAWALSASKQALYERALSLTETLPDFLTDIIRFAGVEGVQPPFKFVEYIPPDTFPTGRVTLLGDAAHAMMPFRGAGANLALLDACDLASSLMNAKSLTDSTEVYPLLERYSQTVCTRGKVNVIGSQASGKDMRKVLNADKVQEPVMVPLRLRFFSFFIRLWKAIVHVVV